MNPPVRTVWFFLLGSVILLGGVSMFVLTPVSKPDPTLLHTLVPVMGLTAVMQLALSVVFPRIARAGVTLLPMTVVRCAICEATAGLGLVLRLLGASPLTVVGFFVAALVGILLARPPLDGAA